MCNKTQRKDERMFKHYEERDKLTNTQQSDSWTLPFTECTIPTSSGNQLKNCWDECRHALTMILQHFSQATPRQTYVTVHSDLLSNNFPFTTTKIEALLLLCLMFAEVQKTETVPLDAQEVWLMEVSVNTSSSIGTAVDEWAVSWADIPRFTMMWSCILNYKIHVTAEWSWAWLWK